MKHPLVSSSLSPSLLLSLLLTISLASPLPGAAQADWVDPSGSADNISPDGQSATSPKIALDSAGDAIIVWSQSDGIYTRIFKSERRSDAWSHPADLKDYLSLEGGNASEARIAMDANGEAILVWVQKDITLIGALLKSEYRGGVWTHPTSTSEAINPTLTSEPEDPQVAMSANGEAVIVWTQATLTGTRVFMSEYRGGSWTHPTSAGEAISPSGYTAREPRVAMDDNGNTIIAWSQGNSLQDHIFVSVYKNGVWTHPASLTDYISPDGLETSPPKLAMNGNGDAVITWRESDSTVRQIFKSEYRGGSWSNPAGLSDNISPNNTNCDHPEVAMDSSGDTIITWQQSDGSTLQIFKSEYRGGAWSNPAGLSDNISPDGTDYDYPMAAMDDNGNAAITWHEDRDIAYRIFRSEFQNNTWTHPQTTTDNFNPTVSTLLGTITIDLEITMNKGGHGLIAWNQSDGINNQIFMSNLSPAAPPPPPPTGPPVANGVYLLLLGQ